MPCQLYTIYIYIYIEQGIAINTMKGIIYTSVINPKHGQVAGSCDSSGRREWGSRCCGI